MTGTDFAGGVYAPGTGIRPPSRWSHITRSCADYGWTAHGLDSVDTLSAWPRRSPRAGPDHCTHTDFNTTTETAPARCASVTMRAMTATRNPSTRRADPSEMRVFSNK
jgi:hypothetical protein